MNLTYKYRIYPTRSQETALQNALDACRWVYNKTLEVRKEYWEEREESLSLYDTSRMLTEWKREQPWLSNAYSQSLQEAQQRVDNAYKAFFRRVKNGESPGYPRFKGDWYKSFTYTQTGFKFIDEDHLHLSKIGDVKIRKHREIEGEVKRLTIKRNSLGKWFALFVVEIEPEPLEPTSEVVGIDLGLRHFATLSNGEQVENPRFFNAELNELQRAQRRLSAAKKGSEVWKKRKRVVQHIHERVENRRIDFAHKLSRKLVEDYQVIVFEDLNIRGMTDNGWASLNRSIADAAWNQLVRFTQYKAENAGRECVLVDPRNTSQECSGCGEVVQKDLSVRVHDCPYCGCTLDREVNAAKNVLSRGLARLSENL
jgi:putative transposase